MAMVTTGGMNRSSRFNPQAENSDQAMMASGTDRSSSFSSRTESKSYTLKESIEAIISKELDFKLFFDQISDSQLDYFYILLPNEFKSKYREVRELKSDVLSEGSKHEIENLFRHLLYLIEREEKGEPNTFHISDALEDLIGGYVKPIFLYGILNSKIKDSIEEISSKEFDKQFSELSHESQKAIMERALVEIEMSTTDAKVGNVKRLFELINMQYLDINNLLQIERYLSDSAKQDINAKENPGLKNTWEFILFAIIDLQSLLENNKYQSKTAIAFIQDNILISLKELGLSLHNISHACYNANKPDLAILIMQQSKLSSSNYSRESNNKSDLGYIEALCNEASASLTLGQWQKDQNSLHESIKICEEALQDLSSSGDFSFVFGALNYNLGEALCYLADLQNDSENLNRGLKYLDTSCKHFKMLGNEPAFNESNQAIKKAEQIKTRIEKSQKNILNSNILNFPKAE